MVGVSVLLQEDVSQGGVLVVDQLLHELVDGEDSQVGGATSFLHNEVGDEFIRLEVVWSPPGLKTQEEMKHLEPGECSRLTRRG